jgi:hypothetical protein
MWPWLIGLIILALILWYFFARRTPDTGPRGVADTTATMTTPRTDSVPAAAPVGSTTTPPPNP